MKKIIKTLKFPVTFLLILISFIACDKDFTNIESAVLSKENANFNTKDTVIPISAYNKRLDAVPLQSNGLTANLLGVFNDPAYGKTTASIVTQIIPTTNNPNFGINPEIDKVVLKIPYFSTVVGLDNDGNNIYSLDSLYGNAETEIKLSIYQNKYLLRDIDPYTTTISAQNYYSNPNSNQNSALNGSNIINFDEQIGELVFEDKIKPSNTATITTTGTGDDKVETRSAPALTLTLKNDNDFWKTTIIDKQGDPVLSNSDNFKNYFRGLYIKAEETAPGDGNMFLINLAGGNITIHYTSGETDARTQSTYTLNFSGNKLNTFINDYNKVTFPTNPNKELGDELLYLKGTAGSMAVVDLFVGENTYKDDNKKTILAPALEAFKKTYRASDGNGGYLKDSRTGDFILKRLINDAQLVIYEYEDETMSTLPVDENGDAYHKYDRIYAYDIKNNEPTIDYQIDPTINTQLPLSSAIISLSQRDSLSPKAGKYKILLTEHLNNILLRDSTNTKIGLVLSNNVNYINNAKILNSNDAVTSIPAATLITPRGTILYGSNQNVHVDKRLKLKIIYTKPKEN